MTTGNFHGLTPARLDEVDQEILELLQKDGRMSVTKMADCLNVSRASVSQRLQRLLKDRIVSVNAMAHPVTHGYTESALIGVRVDHRVEEVSKAVAQFPEVYYVVTATGRYDITVELLARNSQHLMELSMSIRKLPGVLSTEIITYIDTVKWSYRPLAAREEASTRHDTD